VINGIYIGHAINPYANIAINLMRRMIKVRDMLISTS